MADDATYTAPTVGAVAVAARIFVNRSSEFFGDQKPGVYYRTEVRILKEDVPSPKPGGTLIVGSESFKLEVKLLEDESTTRWVASPLVAAWIP